MKKLLVSGCSFTGENFAMDGIKKRWCNYVADNLGYELVNLGRAGAGNEYIFTSLYNYLKNNKPDMVIAAWSKSERRDFKNRDRWYNDRMDLRGDIDYHIEKTNNYKELMELVCKTKGIKYHSFQMIELYPKDRDNVQGKTIGFLSKVEFEKVNEDFISDADRHPSAIGHEKIGQYIYENL